MVSDCALCSPSYFSSALLAHANVNTLLSSPEYTNTHNMIGNGRRGAPWWRGDDRIGLAGGLPNNRGLHLWCVRLPSVPLLAPVDPTLPYPGMAGEAAEGSLSMQTRSGQSVPVLFGSLLLRRIKSSAPPGLKLYT